MFIHGKEIAGYVYACPNEGRCQQLLWEKHGWEWKPFWRDEDGRIRRDGIPYGAGRAYPTEECWGIHGSIEFKCCTRCGKPVNAFAAADLNKQLGFTIPTVEESLDSITTTKNSIAELLASLEG